MSSEDLGRRKYFNRKSVRPQFAEDVYGEQATEASESTNALPSKSRDIYYRTAGRAGGSTVTISGNRFDFSNTDRPLYNSLTASNRIEVVRGGGVGQHEDSPSLHNWCGSSKKESFGEFVFSNDYDHKSRQFVGELDFQYADCDKFSVELAELYTYSEMEDFLLNFEEFCMYLLRSKYEKTERWVEWSADSKSRLSHDVLQGLDSANPGVRLSSARLVLYILQGTYGDYTDMDDEEERNSPVEGGRGEDPEEGFFRKISQRLRKADCAAAADDALTPPDIDVASAKTRGTGGHEENCLLNAAANAYYVYESGIFQALCTMLAVEREESARKHLAKQQSVSSLNSSVGGGSMSSGASLSGGGGGTHRRSATLADNESLRVIINCLYHMVEAIRRPELVGRVAEFCRTLTRNQPRAHSPYVNYTPKRLEELRNAFLVELDEPLDSAQVPLVIFLFDMMPDFVRGKCPHFPIKKILLLTWKILLATLGGTETLRVEKTRKRHAAGLSLIEDTLDVAAGLKPVAYGADNSNNSDIFISKLSRIGLKNPKVVSMECGKMRFLNRQTACTSSTNAEDSAKSQSEDDADEVEKLDDNAFHADDEDANVQQQQQRSFIGETPNTPKADGSDGSGMAERKTTDKATAALERMLELKLEKAITRPPKGTAFRRRLISTSTASSPACVSSSVSASSNATTAGGDQTPRAANPDLHGLEQDSTASAAAALLRLNTLPWRTKVCEKDLETFLQKERQKYFGYQLPNDSTTIFGLPAPVLQSVAAFRRNIYVSLGDLQIKSDNDYNRYTFSRVEIIEDTKTERLYRRMVPNMTEYVITLLKTKSDAVTILSDVLTPETDTNEMLSNSMSLDISGKNVLEEAVRFAIDINRHKELIVKSSSAIIILLLKFFRLNHIYQFESFAQYLVLANCLPLVLKFIDQNIVRYIQSKHELTPLNYPQCALHYVRNDGEWPVLNADNVYDCDTEQSSYYLWRNVFSSINLLRVLNKLTKWKHARTMMLVVFKSAPVLKRCLRVRLGIFQLYVLKLLKMQARFLGRQWRKSNMDIISSIYMKVRHRLNDDWAFANETRSKSWDFQAEENELGVAVKRFNRRRYKNLIMDTGDAAMPKDECRQRSASKSAANAGEVITNAQMTGAANNIGTEHGDAANEGPFAATSAGDAAASAAAAAFLDGMDPRDFEPYDNCLQSVLAWEPKFSERFTRNYAKWVENEVINAHVDWDFLLESTSGIAFENQFGARDAGVKSS